MHNQAIRFFHRGQIVEVSGAHPTRSVLDWLREDARCVGTKEGCNEGDCGACTVVIAELPEHGDAPERAVRGLNLRSVNACIQFLPTLHGKALLTVEDLKSMGDASADSAARAELGSAAQAGLDNAARAGPDSAAGAARPAVRLHPAQQALVECHGSQCGFCTPGFVMSMVASYEQHRAAGTRPTRQQMADELSGNLCRCTGYRPILDAAERMHELPEMQLDTAPVIAALRRIDHEGAGAAFSYAASNSQHYPPRTDRFHAPKTLEQLAALRTELPHATLLAGSTDIGLWVNKQFRDLGDIVFLGDVSELKQVRPLGDGALHIGAGVSLETAWRALARRHAELTEVWLRFASVPIRNAGTMGGNVANGSPIGDCAPVLMALDALVELRQGERVRRVPLDGFYTAYMKNQMQPGEFVSAIVVPPSPAARRLRVYKISKRFDCDISALCAGLAIELDGDTVRQVRLAFGGMAATVKRASTAEAVLLGRRWSQDQVNAAQAALATDFQPLSDMRASAAYRLQVAQNLLQRFWLETRREQPLPAAATSVWGAVSHPATPRVVEVSR